MAFCCLLEINNREIMQPWKLETVTWLTVSIWAVQLLVWWVFDFSFLGRKWTDLLRRQNSLFQPTFHKVFEGGLLRINRITVGKLTSSSIMTVINAKKSVVSGCKKNRLAAKSITTPIPTKTVNTIPLFHFSGNCSTHSCIFFTPWKKHSHSLNITATWNKIPYSTKLDSIREIIGTLGNGFFPS